MSDLAEFLLARIAEDEAVARAAIDPDRPGIHWHWVNSNDDSPSVPRGQHADREYMTDPASLRTVEEFPTSSVGNLPSFAISHAEEVRSGPALHIARHDPARVLAECEAKRAIVEEATHPQTSSVEGYNILRILAVAHADHPDYDEEWRP